jgi:hypothetical protein
MLSSMTWARSNEHRPGLDASNGAQRGSSPSRLPSIRSRAWPLRTPVLAAAGTQPQLPPMGRTRQLPKEPPMRTQKRKKPAIGAGFICS